MSLLIFTTFIAELKIEFYCKKREKAKKDIHDLELYVKQRKCITTANYRWKYYTLGEASLNPLKMWQNIKKDFIAQKGHCYPLRPLKTDYFEK